MTSRTHAIRIGAEWRPHLTAPHHAYLIERYMEDFDAMTVNGGVDILVAADAEQP